MLEIAGMEIHGDVEELVDLLYLENDGINAWQCLAARSSVLQCVAAVCCSVGQ